MNRSRNIALLEEHNVGRLGLISVMSRLPEPNTNEWQDHLMIGSTPGTIRCFSARPDMGIPHGFDNDISAAIHTLYIAQGCPDSGRIEFTAREILELIGIPTSAETYNRVATSIQRLHYTHYEITANWFNASVQSHGSASFTYLSNIASVITPHPFHPRQKQIIYTITLNEHVRHNLSLQHLITLKPEILSGLASYSPTTRATYRLLESLRRDPQNLTRASDELTVTLPVLKKLGRVLSDDQRPTRILRTFTPALEALQRLGHLTHVEEIKSRSNHQLLIRFSRNDDAYDARAYAQLIDAGVYETTARDIASRFDPKDIAEVLQIVEEKKAAGQVEDSAALTVHILRNAGKTYIQSQIKKRESQKEKAAKPSTPAQQNHKKISETSEAEAPAPSTPKATLMTLTLFKLYLSPSVLARATRAAEQGTLTTDHLRPFFSQPGGMNDEAMTGLLDQLGG